MGRTHSFCFGYASTVVDIAAVACARASRTSPRRELGASRLLNCRRVGFRCPSTVLVLLSQTPHGDLGIVSVVCCVVFRIRGSSGHPELTRGHRPAPNLDEDSYLVERTMIWVLPMLGFLGSGAGISTSTRLHRLLQYR